MRLRRQLAITLWLLLAPVVASVPKEKPVPVRLAWPPQPAAYGIEYLESIRSPEDLAIRRGLFARLGDVMFGPPDRPKTLLHPFALATDAGGRLLVADTGARMVHVLDPVRRKHLVLAGRSKDRFESPVGLDADAAGNIYVADSALGKIFVFDKDGRFRRYIGEAKGEGLFKRPTGLAVDRASGRIYLTDTLRHKLYVLSPSGAIEQEWGRRGSGPGEFNFPTAVALAGDRVLVLDAMNFRVQMLDAKGAYIASFGKPANEPGGFFRPKGLAVDAQRGLIYVVDAMFEVVQAFTLEGRLVLAFGHPGSRPGEFRLPAGICVQPDGRVLVADSYNGRVQVFRAFERAGIAGGGR